MKGRWLALFTAVLFGAFALRLWNLGTQSLWHDEAWSVMSAYQPLTPIDPNYPPFFTVLLGVWIRLAGDSVWAMRFWSALLGVVTVAVVAFLVRRWFGNRTALMAAIFVTVSPIQWVYSQEIRSYVLVPLLVVILLLLADLVLLPQSGYRNPARTAKFTPPQPLSKMERGVKGRWYSPLRIGEGAGGEVKHPFQTPLLPVSRRTWLWLALVEIILLYTHNLAVPVVAWLNVTVIAVLLARRHWSRLRTWLLIQAGLFVLYLPWLITQRPTGTPLNTPPAVGPALLWDIWQSYFTGIKAMLGADRDLMALVAAFGIVAVGGLVAVLVYYRTRRTLLVLSQAILIPVFELIIILAAHIDFHPRYFLAGVPAALTLIALGLDILRRQKFLTPLALTAAVLLAVGIMVQMARVTYSSPVYQHDDFRAIAQRYAQLGSGDAIIIPYGWEPTLAYYGKKMNFKARVVGIPLHSDADTIMDRLQADVWEPHTARAELLTWYQLPADVRGAYSCLLGATGTQSDSLTVNGLKTVTYTDLLPPLRTSANVSADFQQIQLSKMEKVEQTGENSCVITHWRLPEHTAENWRLTARALNPLGWTIAQTDTDLLDDRQLPTSSWKAGQEQAIFSLLSLPEGTPPQTDFRVVAGVYGDKTALDVVQDGKVVGRQAQIGTVRRRFVDRQAAQPTSADLNLGDGLYLHHQDVSAGPFQSGQEVRAAFEWWQAGDVHALTARSVLVSLEGMGWHISSSVNLLPVAKLLTWQTFTIPPDASGKATLKAMPLNGRWTTLAEYDVERVERLMSPPEGIRFRLDDMRFGEAGALIGVTAPDKPVTHAEPLSITLYWRATGTPPTAYTVFVHLLDAGGQVVAQSDAQPADGSRPTTGWIKDEYIVDKHVLTFKRQDFRGQCTLEVGLYEQSTGKRVLLEDGRDHIVLPMLVEVR